MNGIIVINKDIGPTSRDVVNVISKKFNTKKVGHTGTLDPGASGVLVICIGKALKVAELFSSDDKEYIAGITLGLEYDTIDLYGKLLKEEDVNIPKEEIIKVVNSFKGSYLQEVPLYSAVKVNGRKLYQYARSGQEVKLPSKEVSIKEIEILDDIKYIEGKIYFKIRCVVSKGTYIRSLVRDIGKKLGTIAVMNSLVRTRQGIFKISDSYKIDEIVNDKYKLVSITEAFPNIKTIKVNDEIAFKVRNGVILDKLFDQNMAFITDNSENLIALYRNDGKKCRAYKMFL